MKSQGNELWGHVSCRLPFYGDLCMKRLLRLQANARELYDGIEMGPGLARFAPSNMGARARTHARTHAEKINDAVKAVSLVLILKHLFTAHLNFSKVIIRGHPHTPCSAKPLKPYIPTHRLGTWHHSGM
jgi:hypothetical protein